MDPDFRMARRILGVALLAAGKVDDAILELTTAAGPTGDDHISLASLAHAKAVSGSADEARAIVARLESPADKSYVSGYYVAIAHAGLGNRDGAFRLLEKACADREPSLVNLAVEPRFAPLRRDPRYAALLAQLRLPA
jgi:hypothetical protein